MNSKIVLIAAALVALMLACPAGLSAQGQPLPVGQPADPPAWAKAQIDQFKALNDFAETAVDKFFDPKTGKPCASFHHGTADDVVEGISTWDRFVLLAGSDKARAGMVRAWKYIYGELVRTGDFVDGFYAKGYDAEHTCELFQMLWACMEFDPADKELAEQNRKLADVLIDRCYDKQARLLKHRILDSTGGGRRKENPRVDDMINLAYILAAFRAYMTTGDAKYRDWAIEYGTSWNELAGRNNGVFPFSVNSATREIPKEWWGSSSFDYKVYGLIVAGRYLHGWPVAMVMMDKGNAKHLSGLNTTLDAMFGSRTDGLPNVKVDETGWSREGKTCWFVPKLLDRQYAITFEPAVAERIKRYYAAVTKVKETDKQAASEEFFLRWQMFTYFGQFDLDWAADQFKRGAATARSKRQKIAALTELPTTGDGITEQVQHRPVEINMVDGGFFGDYDNHRAGAPATASIGYRRPDGSPGLPDGVAALVRRVDKDGLHLLLCNTNDRPATLHLVGGFYGQHRIERIVYGSRSIEVAQTAVQVELPARGLADLTIKLTRFASDPTLTPTARRTRPSP